MTDRIKTKLPHPHSSKAAADAFCEMEKARMPREEMAEAYGVTSRMIATWASDMRRRGRDIGQRRATPKKDKPAPFNQNPDASAAAAAAFLAMRREGMAYGRIAEHWGHSKGWAIKQAAALRERGLVVADVPRGPKMRAPTIADMTKNQGKPEHDPKPTTIRKCMTCREPFESEHFGHRRCYLCNNAEDNGISRSYKSGIGHGVASMEFIPLGFETGRHR